MSAVIEYFSTCLQRSAPVLPAQLWWLSGLCLLVLLALAIIDARSHRVPDAIVLAGLAGVRSVLAIFGSIPFAAAHLFKAVVAAFVIFAVNQLWFTVFKHDALGMGDAKWTGLAVSVFGFLPLIYAWGIGAVTASLSIGLHSIMRRPIRRLAFVPYLFIGLVGAILWLRLLKA